MGTIDNYNEINRPRYQKFIFADKSGIINKFNTEKIGWALVELGCGYKYTHSILDYTVGIQFISKVGDNVNSGEKLFRVFNSDKEKLEKACLLLKNHFISITRFLILNSFLISIRTFYVFYIPE